MNCSLNKSLLFALILAVFLDIGNFFMPMPIYTPLFLHSSFLMGLSHEIKSIMLGTLIACYGIAQLFGGPIFGELSDQFGRKKVLVASLFISMFGCCLGGISLTTGSIGLVFISRLLIGLSSGTIAVVFAITADHSDESNRAKNLGYVSVGAAIGATIGPMIGGHLASTQFLSWFGYATPFYFMVFLYGITIFLLLKLLPMDAGQREKKKIKLFTSFQNIYTIISSSELLRYLVIMALFFQLGTESFYLVSPVLAVKNFVMTSAMIGNHFLAQGVTSAITSWFINKYLSKYFTSRSIYLFSITLLVLSFLFLFAMHSSRLFYIPFIGIGIFGTLCWVHLNNLFSQSVNVAEQGLVFGVSQALWSSGGIISGILVGLITALNYKFNALLPVLFETLSLMIIIMMIKKKLMSERQ